tara:strand:+ start:42 stop:239 length:198 start_codon:yes stop_codon:yes gene_type:complete
MNEYPRIEEELIAALETKFKINDAHLTASEWDRAYLAGQRSVVQLLSLVRQQQEQQNQRATQKRI